MRKRPLLRFAPGALGAWLGVVLFSAAGAGAAEPVAKAGVKGPGGPDRNALARMWREAEAYAATLPAGEVMVGCGDSMAPLLPDRTVIVIQRQPMQALRAGMTVVFIGDRGRPVAHRLQRYTAQGWIVRGLANPDADRTRVVERNYVGTVVRAFVPVLGPVAPGGARLPAGEIFAAAQ